MSALSDWAEDMIVRALLMGEAFVPPTTPFLLALYTSATDDDGGGTEVTPGAYSYARQQIAFASSGIGVVSNDGAILFENVPVANVSHVAVWDSAPTPHLICHGPLTETISTQGGQTLRFAPGMLIFSLA